MRLMIVDDNAGMRQLLREVVATSGDVVCECASGEEAVRTAPDFKPDCVTMDVRMSGLSGLDATRAILAAQPSVRIVIVTYYDEARLRCAATEAGAIGFVLKERLGEVHTLLTSSDTSTKAPAASTGTRVVGCSGSDSVLRVLMVEDCAADCELIGGRLTECGYTPRIELVCTEDAMRRALEGGQCDIVFTDHDLPRFSGLAALELIRKMGLQTPVLCVSGSADPRIIERILQAGAHAYVNKDDLSTLCDSVKSALRTRSNRNAQNATNGAATSCSSPTAATEPAAAPAAPAEANLRDRVAEVEAAIALLESFAGTVAHQLRAPLRHIREFTAILREEHAAQVNDDARQLLSCIDEATQIMTKRIDGLMALARADREPLPCEPLSTQTLVHEAWNEACPEAERKRIQLKAEHLPEVHGDRALMHLVFVNLLANAVKCSTVRPTPVVEVHHTVVGDKAVFIVKFKGDGFDTRQAEMPFQPVHRSHSSDQFPGTGLGLTTVRRILQRHGGRIWAEAAMDQGANFYFSFYFMLPTPLE